jgi:tetratricopeptide (TPR) repeat protein
LNFTKFEKNYVMRVFLLFFLILTSLQVIAQPKPKEKQSSQNDMNKLMEDAMKGMSEEEKAEMKKMMGSVMPALMEQNSKMADYPEFTSNKQLVPKKDMARINAIPKKKLSQADIGPYAANLYNKIMTKGDAAEIAIVKKVIAKTSKANDIGGAAILAMLQGHPQAALALSMKAVQSDPANANWQNNMASLLTQYGYPEQAVPVLQKLKNQFPTNSTVLNNLAHAWLGLGETDSAKNFSGYAVKANPNHPDATLCGGLMEEIKGDPIKATDDYIEAMENSINPFTETVIKNNNGQSKFEKIDFEKIKKSIAIYEYFPKNWVKDIPLLSGNVNNYAADKAIQDGYQKMDEQFNEKLQLMIDELGKEVQALVDKGEEEFVKQMAAETINGLSFMSKPAALVSIILHQYGAGMTLKLAEDMKSLEAKISVHKKAYETATKNASKCEVYDAAANKLMQAVNPMIKKFFLEKAEEYRQWLNALATWNWYIAGNPKNSIMLQDMAYTAVLESLYLSAIKGQQIYTPACKSQKDPSPASINQPEIPNFTCPAVVSIPVGTDWQQLTIASKNFDKNISGTKQNANNPVPNSSIAFGIGIGTIAQPGRSPFVKTANGSISPGMINEYDPGKMLEDYQDDLALLPDLRKNNLAKALLKKMMTADCKNVNKYKYKPPVFEVGFGELILEEPTTYELGTGELVIEDPLKKIKEIKEDGDVVYVTYDDGSEVVFMEDGSILEIDAPKNPESIGKNNVSITPKPVTPDIISKNKVYGELKDIKKQYDANGLQPSISSGIQAPGTFTPVKGLFQ